MGAEREESSVRLRAAARRLVRRLDQLGRISDERGRLTRTFLSPAMRRANAAVGGWMRSAGLEVRVDGTGNLIGRIGNAAETLLIGSHLDTVRDAGRFDGALGVLTGIAAVEALGADAVRRLPFSVEVVGFSEEEGVRFSSAYLGSKGFFGTLGPADLARVDRAGARVRDVLAEFGATERVGWAELAGAGGSPKRRRRGSRVPSPEAVASRPGPPWKGYLEVHIEQGPVLEKAGASVGVVTAIAGQTRGRVVFIGRAGHAGTTPMGMRRDALAGAAEWIMAVEALARRCRGLMATVGTIEAQPGAPNVIPGAATLSLDVRHAEDGRRHRALGELLARGRAIARRRQLRFSWTRTQADGAVACDPGLTALLAAAAAPLARGRCPRLVSGAGHDAVVAAGAAPVALLFVRCRRGLSHHPDEFASPRDIAAGLRVTCEFVRRLASR